MAEGSYRTDDLALATVLAIAGYAYEVVKYTERKALWIFSYSSEKEEEFDDLLADYEEFNYLVEPKRFAIRWAEMRGEMFERLDATRPVTPAA